jgi:hypothetical protein
VIAISLFCSVRRRRNAWPYLKKHIGMELERFLISNDNVRRSITKTCIISHLKDSKYIATPSLN